MQRPAVFYYQILGFFSFFEGVMGFHLHESNGFPLSTVLSGKLWSVAFASVAPCHLAAATLDAPDPPLGAASAAAEARTATGAFGGA